MPDNILKALIRKTETAREGAAQYETIIGHNEKHLAKPLTDMTVDEIIDASDGWRKRFGTTSGAAGAYQIIKPTLIGLKRDLGLTGKEKFTPELQDNMCDVLLRRRGFERFMRGQIGIAAFGNSLALEWASFPLLVAAERGGVKLKRGQSYYDGHAGNSALIKPEVVEDTLTRLRASAAPTVPTYMPGLPRPETEPLSAGEIGALSILVVGVLGLIWLAYTVIMGEPPK